MNNHLECNALIVPSVRDDLECNALLVPFVHDDLECNALPVRNGVRGNVLSVHVYKKYAASRHSSSGIAPIPVLTA